MLILCPWARKPAIWSKKYNNAWNRWMFKVLWPVERSISTPRKIQSTWKSTWERKWLKLRKKHKKQFCTWQRKWWLQKQNSSNKKDNNDVMFLIHFDILFYHANKQKKINSHSVRSFRSSRVHCLVLVMENLVLLLLLL